MRNPFNVPEDTSDKDMKELRRGIEPLKLPVVEVKCDDDQAIEILLTSNMHRSKVSLIEKIRSCGFVYRALRRKGRYSERSEKAADVVGNMFHLKPKQVQRYSTLLNLNEKLLMIVFREKPDLTSDELQSIAEGCKEVAKESSSKIEEDSRDEIQSYFTEKMPAQIRKSICVFLAKWKEAASPENFSVTVTELSKSADDVSVDGENR